MTAMVSLLVCCCLLAALLGKLAAEVPGRPETHIRHRVKTSPQQLPQRAQSGTKTYQPNWAEIQNSSEAFLAFTQNKPSQSFKTFYEALTKTFDENFPSPAILAKRNGVSVSSYSPVQLSNMHPKRCIVLDNQVAKERYVENRFLAMLKQAGSVAPEMIFVTTSCLGVDSLGNQLGAYFENLMCSYFSGLHFISAVPVWEPGENDRMVPLLSKLPYFVEHPFPQKEQSIAKQKLLEICKCPGSCHERQFGLWTRGIFLIKPILAQAVKYQYQSFLENPQHKIENFTTIVSTDLFNGPKDKPLPLIPDVAIHYRCGDNFVGHYGFLPFRAIREILKEKYQNNEIQTIFILADAKDRKTKHKRHLVQKCDSIFNALFDYMNKHFPKANIVIRRGDNIYLDFIRLSYARITICSVSTFCLWPAVLNGRNAYFPQTKLIVAGNTAIDLGFNWITNPSYVVAAPYEGSPANQLVSLLSTD